MKKQWTEQRYAALITKGGKLKGNESVKKINDQKENRSEESQKIIGQNNNN